MIMQRRDFGRMAMGVAAGATLAGRARPARAATMYQRPPISQRGFSNPAVERTIARVLKNIKNPKLAQIFTNTYPFALDNYATYTEIGGVPDTYVSTGDIPAMWLRDSTVELEPFINAAVGDHALRQALVGLIHRQARCIQTDRYANAFNKDFTIWERKYELDSLCYPVRLAFNYWRTTGDRSGFDTEWFDAARTIVATMREQQRPGGTESGPYQYTGSHSSTKNGWGNPIRPVGLIVSVFRPSDDPTKYSFLVPSNLFAVTSLYQLTTIAIEVYNDWGFAASCAELADELTILLKRYAIATWNGQRIWAYEVDGLGNQFLADDANLPNFLGLPYLGAVSANDPIYRATRAFSLSQNNPYYHSGAVGGGIGSPHTDPANAFWPLGLITQGITSRDDAEIVLMLRTLIDSDGGTGLMHESVDVNDPTKWTRELFGWANEFFAEFIVKLNAERPALLRLI